MKIRNISKMFILLAVVAIFGLSPLVVGAIEGTDNTTSTEQDDTTTSNSQSRAEVLREKAAEVKEQAIARLEGRKLELCRNREQRIQTIFANTANRSQGHYDQISNAYNRVENFYVSKELNIENYETLKSEIDANKEQASLAVGEIKDQKPQFSCNSDNPKAQAEEYKALVKNKISTLVSYRDSVRKLIDAIKTSLVTTEEASNEN